MKNTLLKYNVLFENTFGIIMKFREILDVLVSTSSRIFFLMLDIIYLQSKKSGEVKSVEYEGELKSLLLKIYTNHNVHYTPPCIVKRFSNLSPWSATNSMVSVLFQG